MPERYVGETLGKYRVDAVVGTGGFAWVYRAFDPDLEIPVALKVLKPQYAGDEVFESRFRREASTAAKLRHPNIIKIFAVGKERGAVYFAMDFLPNGLADRLDVMTVLPEEMLIRLGIDVARALGYAHREGVVHRDIKTDNVLFDAHGNAVVADFGIARAVVNYTKQTGTNMVVGTPQYFAPEQARGQQIDGRADIYALGVTLYRAATGALPFNGDDWYEIARQHVETRPEKPRTLNAGLSRDIQAVILRCLEKDPADRFATGEEMAEALEAIQYERGPLNGARTQIMPQYGDDEPRLGVRGALPAALRARGARLALAGALALGLVGTAVGLARRGRPSDAISGAPVPAPPARTALAPASAPHRTLSITAPAAAQLTLNDVPVGTGSWSADSLPPGEYEVAAALRPQAGCPSTRVTQRVTLADTGLRTVRLAPRPCWPVVLDLPPTATYALTASDGGRTRSGSATSEPVTLPEGSYRLRVTTPGCEEFRSTERVAGDRRRIRVRPFCR